MKFTHVACTSAFLFGFGLFGLGCGSTPTPKELLDARAAFSKAQAGPARENSPAQVHVAKESLDVAEKAFDDDPSAQETRDRAYVALRQAQLADAQGRLSQAETERNVARKELEEMQVSQLKSTKQQLNSTKQQLTSVQQRLEDSEKRTKEALAELAKMAQVKDEPRGMVITLSGQVLFASGKAALLPAALSGLDNVAIALKSTPDRNAVVEGHTDSQGARSFNMDLATRRAQSVREYIVSRGVPPETVRAVGIGPDRPVADNQTAEGRANNRRVEIIISPPEHK